MDGGVPAVRVPGRLGRLRGHLTGTATAGAGRPRASGPGVPAGYAASAAAGAVVALIVLWAVPDLYTARGLVAVQPNAGTDITAASAAGRRALLSQFLIDELAAQFGRPPATMRRLISVSQEDGLALTVSATMRNPARSADVVNALLDDYVIAHALGEQGAGVRGLPAVRVLRHPSVPTAPDKPAASLAGVLGAAAGLAIAVLVRISRRWAAAARARESVERSLRRAGMNVLGRLDPRAGRSMADALLQSGTGPQMAAMRATRDKLGDAKVVGFVGGQPGPAASAAACAYARAAARDGQHVLLVDGDPEGAFMSRLLGEPRGRLSDVLRGEAEWRDCVTHDRVEGLDTLVGPTQGAGARRLGAVIDQAVTVYDQIVLGAPKGTRLPRCDRAVTVLDGGEAVVLAGKSMNASAKTTRET